MVNAMIKSNIRIVGSINDTKGIELTTKISSAVIPKFFKTEYTVSIYAIIIPKIINIHAESLIFGQSKIARNAANAPRIS